MKEVKQVIDLLEELQEDTSVSKNVKSKIQIMKQELQETDKENLSLTVNKILSDLEELSSDVNIPMFVRTQIWSVTSLLETLS
ncbi:UPF0147 family protein [Candidatus Woesearchaeota archaeon]|nr:UPF0147 family protein [Candidatus Woesearchaeota archaeon]